MDDNATTSYKNKKCYIYNVLIKNTICVANIYYYY